MLSGPLQLATEILTALKRKSLWVSLIGLALLVAAIGPVGIILAGYLVAGAEAGVFFRITREASLGSNQGPRFEIFSPFEDVFLPLVLVFLAVLPIIAANYWAGGALTDLYAVGTEYGPTPGEWALGPKLLLGMGILLYPLLISIGATTQSISAVLSPSTWLASLNQLGLSYLLAGGFFYGLWALEFFYLARLAGRVANSMAMPFLPTVLALMIIYIPRALRYEGLGRMIRHSLDKQKIPRARLVNS